MRQALLGLALLLSGCGTAESPAWLGYVEGETALVAPPQAGWLMQVAVTRGQEVKENDLLFTLDSTREIAGRDNALAAKAAAEAGQAQSQAELSRARKELTRLRELTRIGGSSTRDLEQAQAAAASAAALVEQNAAQRDEAMAQLMTAEWNLSERTVRARTSGQVQDIFFRQGEYAAAGTPVVSLLPPQNVYVRFFVPEPALAGLSIGSRVHISCDGCAPDLSARVSFIAAEAEFTPPVIYSVGNREKLVFKAEARFDGATALRPGLPVEVTQLPP